jgi:hypothetical protein
MKRSNLDRQSVLLHDSIRVMLTSYFQLNFGGVICNAEKGKNIRRKQEVSVRESVMARTSNRVHFLGPVSHKYLRTSCRAPTRSVSSIRTDVLGGPSLSVLAVAAVVVVVVMALTAVAAVNIVMLLSVLLVGAVAAVVIVVVMALKAVAAVNIVKK